jgi:hypothetical protein
MRFRSNLKTSIAYNASLRKETPNDKVYAAAYYVPPLPPAREPDTTSGVGSTGLWTFDEISDPDGSRILNLKYRNQQVHTFLVDEAAP